MVRGKKRKNPRYEETRSLSQWLDDCPRTNSMEVVGCSGKPEKTHYVMKPSCAWISARGQYPGQYPKKITLCVGGDNMGDFDTFKFQILYCPQSLGEFVPMTSKFAPPRPSANPRQSEWKAFDKEWQRRKLRCVGQ